MSPSSLCCMSPHPSCTSFVSWAASESITPQSVPLLPHSELGAPYLNCLPPWSQRTSSTLLNARLMALSLFKLGVAAGRSRLLALPLSSSPFNLPPSGRAPSCSELCSRCSLCQDVYPPLHEVTVPAAQVSAMEPLRPPHGTIFPS